MYAHDDSGTGTQTGVVWPAQTMPLEYFRADYPWSYSYGEELTEAAISVSLERESDGKKWNFSTASSDGFFTVNNDWYGQSGCVIFRPDGITEFASDDVFHVLIRNGGSVLAQYDVSFFSLNPVSGFTLSKSSLSFEHVGDSGELDIVQIQPSNASTEFIWTSSDESVAKAAQVYTGNSSYVEITAVGVGRAEITATSTNGRVQEVCEINVHDYREVGLNADKTQMEYTCPDCGESRYKSAITSIKYVFWALGTSNHYSTALSPAPEVGKNLKVWPEVLPENHEDSIEVTVDRPDIVTFTTRDNRIFTGIPQHAGTVRITVSSKMNPEVKKTYTVNITGPLEADSLTADTAAENGAVCGVPVTLSLQAAGGKEPYSITYSAEKVGGEAEIIAAASDSMQAVWMPSSEGSYTLRAKITDAEGNSIEKTVENYTVRKAAVAQSTAAPAAFADPNIKLVYGEALSSCPLNSDKAVFVGEAGETVEGTLSWENAELLPQAGTQKVSWIFVPKNEAAYERCSGTLTLEVQKASPDISAYVERLTTDRYDPERVLGDEQILGTAQITYNGEKRAVSGTFLWKEEDKVPQAGTQSCAVRFLPEDSQNISEASTEVELTIQKAIPARHEGEAAEIRTLTYGDTLSEHSAEVFSLYEKETSAKVLRGSYKWKKADTIPKVSDSRSTAYTVIFTPEDANYEPYREAVYVEVNRAEIAARPAEEITLPYEAVTAEACTLPEGWSLSEADAKKALTVGNAVSVTAYYKDQENYKNPTQIIEITRQPCEHPSTEKRTVLEPTCVDEGVEKTFCTVCEAELGEKNIDALGHRAVTDAAVAATCTESGLTEGSHCEVCSEILTAQEEIPALGHRAVTDAAAAATCTAIGLTEGSHCEVCNETLTAQKEIPALGHRAVTDAAVAATCTESGLTEGSHCEVCSETLTAQEEIPALGHRVVTDAGAAATCTESGLTDGSHCEVCNEILTVQEEIPAGHKIVTDEAVAATCKTDGLTEGSHCEVCGEILVEQKTIAAFGHTEVKDQAADATCTTEGVTEGSHCETCNEILTAQKKIPALGHNYPEYSRMDDKMHSRTCDRCGNTEKQVHRWDSGKITKEATVTAEGVKNFRCEICGAEKTEKIAKIKAE
ncbi:MAG: Ig-like domain-containing protein, partial [Eubacteriales bacterium]|nr:Ig-like domain-containing protein [Eubacteriales bacterium]